MKKLALVTATLISIPFSTTQPRNTDYDNVIIFFTTMAGGITLSWYMQKVYHKEDTTYKTLNSSQSNPDNCSEISFQQPLALEKNNTTIQPIESTIEASTELTISQNPNFKKTFFERLKRMDALTLLIDNPPY